MGANEIIIECNALAGRYSERNSIFKENFLLLALNDEMAQEDMESFVANDPRTMWNMATYLLQPKPLVHKINRLDRQPMEADEALATEVIENLLRRVWVQRNKRHMRKGKKDFFGEFIGMLNLTGWWAIPHGVLGNQRFLVDVWEPGHVYPDFSDDEEEGMVKLARITSMPVKAAHRRARRENWDISTLQQTTGSVTEYQLFELEEGKVLQSIVVGNALVAEKVQLSGLRDIPVLVGATGGIPMVEDSVNIHSMHENRVSSTRLTRAAAGQGILATNSGIFRSVNRQQTFVQQILHDTANPVTWERGGQVIVNNPDDMNKRGAHFRMGFNEEIGTLGPNSIPPEFQTLLFNLRNMQQRGGFSDVVFGNIIQEVSATLVSQAAESAQQILSPFHVSSQYVVSEVSQGWFNVVKQNPGRFDGLITTVEVAAFQVLQELDEEYEVNSSYAVRVPGDIANRVQMMRFASPSAEISPETSMNIFLHEVPNPREEMENVKAAEAERHPVMKMVALVGALQDAAVEVEEADPSLAQLYVKTAERLMQELPTQGSPQPTSRPNSGVGTNVIPATEQQAMGGTNGRTAG